MPKSPLTELHEMVTRFNKEIIGLPIPDKPTILNFERGEFRLGHLREEMAEIEEAMSDEKLEDVTDGLLDLIYVALGTLLEMGIPPGAAFEEVHRANMDKQKGNLAKRVGSLGYDAIKPEGWVPPSLTPYLTITRDQVRMARTWDPRTLPAVALTGLPQDLGHFNCAGKYIPGDRVASDPVTVKGIAPDNPKILVLGYSRHGKDTVSEMLRDKYQTRFVSSSMFCAEHVILAGINAETTPKLAKLKGDYNNPAECFDDRHNHRSLWYDTIRAFNRPDATALGRAIFEDHDVYCGLRSKAELNALKNAGLVDYIIWVDRSDHLPPEGPASCTVEPWMADYVLDNNGTLEDLELSLTQLIDNLWNNLP